jgi:hypothetical protein
MSIGNTKSDGNIGNNFPYQHNVLKGLQAVLQDLQNLLVNTTGLATESTLQIVETNTTGVARTPNFIRPTIAGNVNTVATNFYSVSVANVGMSNGTVLGAIIKPGEVLNFSADALNNYFTSFAYDATGTEFIIIYIV